MLQLQVRLIIENHNRYIIYYVLMGHVLMLEKSSAVSAADGWHVHRLPMHRWHAQHTAAAAAAPTLRTRAASALATAAPLERSFTLAAADVHQRYRLPLQH